MINPDGVIAWNGEIVQGRGVKESVKFDQRRIAPLDGGRYQIMTFPESSPIEVVLIGCAALSGVGAGEGFVGSASETQANALANAARRRLRNRPLTPERVKSSLIRRTRSLCQRRVSRP